VTKTIESKHSGTLEITWHNGKKHLNTKNANYSYGSLQRILKFGLKNIELSKINSVLVLGMGGGSVIETLRKDFNYTKTIEAVEIDPVIINIANTEFGISENKNLKIHCADASEFLKANTKHFDLIIVDLFIDLTVPNQFLSDVFWDLLLHSKSSKGTVIFNAAVRDAQHKTINTLVSYLKTKVYRVELLENVNNTNTLIILKSL
jgi:spermidine synthase